METTQIKHCDVVPVRIIERNATEREYLLRCKTHKHEWTIIGIHVPAKCPIALVRTTETNR